MKLFNKHRRAWKIVGVMVLLVLIIAFYRVWISRTKVALVNFQPIVTQALAQANDNPMIKLYEVGVDELEDLDDYDVVLITGMGLQVTADEREQIQKAANKGVPVYTNMATNPDNNISNFDVDEMALMSKYLTNGSKKNYRSLLNFLRRNIDGKILMAGNVEPAQQKPEDYLYFPLADSKTGEDEQTFTSVSDYEKFMKDNGLWREGSKKIMVTGLITDPTELIKALVSRGYNVYPVSSFLHLLAFAEEVRPDAIVNMAHGRLGDDMVQFLTDNNTLLFDPLNVNMPVEDWEADPMGMVGGFMSQSVIMPEIDGAIRTTAVFGLKKDKDGLLHPYAIPERLDCFVQTVCNYLSLRDKPNADKRLAFVYYKGPGRGNLMASGLDVTKSLYNTLLNLRRQGYNVAGLPATVEDFGRDIEREGSLFNSFAHGDVEKYMKTGHPQLVSKEEYDKWTKITLRETKAKEVDKEFGKFPGEHNLLKTADGKLAFPRIQYGNVVLLPQPIAGEGKDIFAITHGTGKVPPHSYLAPYLWIQHGFKADALVHFGTHGSLEYTPQKQVALSNDDWSDRLIGALPHFYYYTIDNVGEAMIAKRRSYAAILSYLTPPFRESQLRNTYSILEQKISDYQNNKGDKQILAKDIKRITEQLGLNKDLGIESVNYSEADIERIGNYAEELADEKITDTPYVTGIPYIAEDIRSTIFSMTVDPIAYSLYAIERLKGKAPSGLETQRVKFNDRYLARANALVTRFYNSTSEITPSELQSIAGLTTVEIAHADSIREILDAPKGMMAMMMAASRNKGNKNAKTAMEKMTEKMNKQILDIPKPKRGPIAKFMRWQMRKMLAKKDPSRMLAVAKKMGASDEDLKKMEAGLKKQMGISNDKNSEKPGGNNAEESTISRKDIELSRAIEELRTALNNVGKYSRLLRESPSLEINTFIAALSGGYIAPSPGGDPIVNPNTLPTGRNLFAINTEETPTAEAWEKGMALAKSTIADFQKRHKGEYPRKVSYTLWSGEFIQTGGATIAQVLYMLGVEPVRDRYGRVSDIRLIPSEELGRPRIDVVVQTSGQLRDLAASRLFLISRAVRMAADATDDSFDNNVKAGVEESERYLVDKGISPKQAREMSSYRVFGGAGGDYGTGIQSMVEQGSAWDDERQIAEIYMNNMGAFYGDQEHWMSDMHEAFSAALTRTDVVVQPRQNNTWGALTLDHVYEFMGGINLAVRQVTGKDPDAVFSDYRNRNNYRIQDSKEAIGVEARTKLFNPTYIKNAMGGGELHTNEIAEMVRNAYGWNVMKPKNIDKEMWDEVYEVYVKDKYNIGVTHQFAEVNAPAMQEITATMMETARKGMWKASPQQLADIASLHTELVEKYGASGSSFEGNNPKLQSFIAQKAPSAAAKVYKQRMRQTTQQSDREGMVMEKQTHQLSEEAENSTSNNGGLIVVSIVLLAFIVMVIIVRRKRKNRLSE